ncbi:hypothetical protein D3C87_1069840 [compost metagenome]
MATKGKQLTAQALEDRMDARAVPVSSPQDEAKAPETTAAAPEPVKHRLAAPVAPAAKTGEDVQALRRLRNALEQAGYRNHPQALEAALDVASAVPVLRAGREVQSYKAEALDYLRGKIQQRDAKGQP